MPYHVGAKGSNDCGGYPVVDDKGKVMGCHPTKNKAGRQVRALYASGAAMKFYADQDPKLEKDMVAEGDFVLAQCEDETHVGIVQYVMTNGMFGIPGSEYAEEATPDNPVVLIRTLEFDEEDGWEETPYMIGAMGQEVTKIPPLPIDVEQMLVDKADKAKYKEMIKPRKGEPSNKELYSRIISEAKRKFDVYPSAVANAWVVQEYKRRGGQYSTTKSMWGGAFDPRNI